MGVFGAFRGVLGGTWHTTDWSRQLPNLRTSKFQSIVFALSARISHRVCALPVYNPPSNANTHTREKKVESTEQKRDTHSTLCHIRFHPLVQFFFVCLFFYCHFFFLLFHFSNFPSYSFSGVFIFPIYIQLPHVYLHFTFYLLFFPVVFLFSFFFFFHFRMELCARTKRKFPL